MIIPSCCEKCGGVDLVWFSAVTSVGGMIAGQVRTVFGLKCVYCYRVAMTLEVNEVVKILNSIGKDN